MNNDLKVISNFLSTSKSLSDEEKDVLIKAAESVDRELTITLFKLDRTEKVKKTTGILLEETIEELEQKRKAVEEQNRELEIDSSLERVRTVAMGMNKSEDLLSICEVSFKELLKLGFDNLRNAVIHVPNDEQKYFMDYDFSDFTGGQIGKIEYGLHPIVDEYLEKIRSAEDAFFEVVIAEDILENWNEFRRKSGQMNDRRLDEADALYYYLFSIGIGDIGISTFKPINDSQIKILKRFRNVFDLAYRRYNDIMTAETQAREAQIEASLERVRAMAMAMHSSEDLTKTAHTFFSELTNLNINPHRCGFGIVNKRTRVAEVHATTATQNKSFKIVTGQLKLYGHPILEKVFEGFEKQEEYHPVLQGKEISEYYGVMNPQVKFTDFSDDEMQYGYYFYFKEGGVFAWFDKEISKDDLQIFRRYTSVLSLTYRRYIDLKTAEARAREAQIEAALERVRSRSMAMHSSDELVEASDGMFDQMKELGIESLRIGIGTINDKDKTVEIWSRSEIEGKVENKIVGVVPFGVHPVFDNMVKAWREKKPYFASERVGDEVKDYYKRLSKYLSYPLPKKFNKRESITTFFFKAGSLNVISLKPLKKEDCDIMIRFAKVFDQTYTRFLDLQKAEAQARESEIQLALERVRARTMAMQKSNEIAQTAANLFEQMEVLGIKPYMCNIAIVDNENKKLKLWSTTNHGNVIPVSSDIPFNENPVFKEMHKGWKNQKKNHTIKLVGEDRVTWTKHISKYVPFEEYKPKNINKSKLIKEAAFFNNFYFRQGYFIIHTKEEISEEDYDIIQRFANVFEQTYTRFLDLENSEYQNKIIQAENERKTEELEEARQLQLAMLPTELPKLPNLDIAVYMQTATEVGGDYYDFNVNEDGVLTGVVGDATGHGMKAGTIVTITKSMFNSLVSDNNILESFAKISKNIKDMKFRQLSMCLMMFTIEGNDLSISTAAMPPVFIYRDKKKKVEEFELRGMPLGTITNFPYKLVEIKIHKGDTILFMSDGFPELQNKNKHMFGYDRTKKEFETVGEKTPEEIINHLKDLASGWSNGKTPDDDVTFVVLKMN